MGRPARFAALLCFAALALAGPAARAGAQALSEAGYIEDFDAAAELYQLTRGDETRAVAMLGIVLTGDIITITDPRGRLSLRLNDRADPVILTRDRSPYTISEPPNARGFSSGLLSWIGNEFDLMDRTRKQRFAANIRGGGGKFAAPILRRPQTLGAGSRVLTIEWQGAKPVDVALRARAGGRPLAGGQGVEGRWTSPPVTLAPGDYALTLKSSDGTTAGNALTVSAPGDLPVIPADLKRSEIPAPLRIVAQAAWLASQGDGAFQLEALQMLSPLRGKFAAADTLAEALAEDRPPRPPP